LFHFEEACISVNAASPILTRNLKEEYSTRHRSPICKSSRGLLKIGIAHLRRNLIPPRHRPRTILTRRQTKPHPGRHKITRHTPASCAIVAQIELGHHVALVGRTAEQLYRKDIVLAHFDALNMQAGKGDQGIGITIFRKWLPSLASRGIIAGIIGSESRTKIRLCRKCADTRRNAKPNKTVQLRPSHKNASKFGDFEGFQLYRFNPNKPHIVSRDADALASVLSDFAANPDLRQRIDAQNRHDETTMVDA
jgi:hypothetical protein